MSQLTMPRSASRESYSSLRSALDAWGGYDHFPEGHRVAQQIVDALAVAAGPLSSAYVSPRRDYVAAKFEGLGRTNVVTFHWSYIFISTFADRALRQRGVDFRQLLADHDVPVDGPNSMCVILSRYCWTEPDRAPKPSGRQCPCSPGLNQGGDLCQTCEQPLTNRDVAS